MPRLLQLVLKRREAAPTVVLSGLPAGHVNEGCMGKYERQDDMDKVNNRHIYKGPNERWMWWDKENAEWAVGKEERIGTDVCAYSVPANFLLSFRVYVRRSMRSGLLLSCLWYFHGTNYP